ncbi:unnamed protein product [Trifolium pratense]|uniref:Uncharacterized protein n=1 Tax=Trifolium pratense TaxID=57577 RepID=A0ACB0LJ90_TRIPR|nr:unnamed protein product [Trifolium pratense]
MGLKLPKVTSMQSIYRAVVHDPSCICCLPLASRTLFSSLATCHDAEGREFPHREQSQDLTRSVDILTAKIGKGNSEEDILRSLISDEAVNGIHPSQNLINRLLCRYKNDWKSALGIFKWASFHSNFKHSQESYDMMVDILGRMKVMEKMGEILEEMREESLITLDTIAKVMRRFAGTRQWKDAVRIFDDLQIFDLEKNTESMNVLLDTLCKEKFVEQAREIYVELKHYIAPNAHTFNIFIHGWCKIRRVEEAHWTIQEMKGYGCRPCVISYSNIIQCYCQEQNFDRVYELLDEMQAQNCSPNVITYTIIMCALAKAKKIDEAFQLVERMNSTGCKPDTLFYNSFIYALGRAGRIDNAMHVFKVAMPKAGVAPNTSTYNSMISMFCFYAQEEGAFGILKEMEDSDRCKWAFVLFEEMVDQDIVPRYRTCRLLLDEVNRINMYEAAEKIEILMKKL